MLKTEKRVTLSGNTEIDGTNIVYYRAEISPDDRRITQSIQNDDLYYQNKEECRKDFSIFTERVYGIEDSDLIEEEEGSNEEQ